MTLFTEGRSIEYYLELSFPRRREKIQYQYPTTINRAPFFTCYLSQLQYHLEQAAHDFLYEGTIDKALTLIKAKPEVIHIETQGEDRLGRRALSSRACFSRGISC